MDLCPVGEGPLGAVCVQPPPTGQPAQALPHSSQLCLALRLHTNADAHALGGPKVSVFEHSRGFRRDYETSLLSVPVLTKAT